jgi:hypothetical protein
MVPVRKFQSEGGAPLKRRTWNWKQSWPTRRFSFFWQAWAAERERAQCQSSRRLPEKGGLEVLIAISLPFSVEEARREVALEVLGKLSVAGFPMFVYDHAETENRALAAGVQESMKKANEIISEEVARRVQKCQMLGADA